MNKLNKLKKNLQNHKKVAIAYSGGVDSTFLAKVAYDTLKNNAIAIMIIGNMHSQNEVIEARNIAKKIGIKLIEIDLKNEIIPQFKNNNKNRCYFCKNFLFEKIKDRVALEGISIILDGTNLDDIQDYRPGLIALDELGVYSPLKECQLTKLNIRAISKELSLETWNKPAFACLASRIPYGSKITNEKLRMVEKAEMILKDKGIKQYRVRHHGDIARIEVEKKEIEKFIYDKNFNDIVILFEKIGFKYVTIDLNGYIQGSMNNLKKEN